MRRKAKGLRLSPLLIPIHSFPSQALFIKFFTDLRDDLDPHWRSFGKQLLDRIRVNEANRCGDDKAARELIKGSEGLLLGNWGYLPNRESKTKLNALLEANQALMTAYVTKDALKALWGYKQEDWARQAWENWLAMATSSGLPPVVRFAKNLAKRIEDTLSHCRWHLNTSILGGINNRIKVLKRIAYGYRDEAYFFLKIRAAFPGNP
jgi:transposase